MNNNNYKKNNSNDKKKNDSIRSFNSYKNGNMYKNNGKNNDPNKEAITSALEKSKQKAKKETARTAIRTGLNSVAPGTGEVANRMLKTEKGDELLDEYSKGETPTKGLKNVARKIKEEKKKKMMALSLIGFMLMLIFLAAIVIIIFKNADTQIYSNENNGKVDKEEYPDNDLINPNIFIKYPGIYEKVEKATKKISDRYRLDIDKYLILATLIAPIENGNITPVDDSSCGEAECYYFEGKSVTWSEFLDLWGDQAEFLAKAQVLTYVTKSSKLNVTCDKEISMEQFAKNDMEVNEFDFWKLFNPANWFTGFRDKTGAEVNARCIYDLPEGESSVPAVRVLSKDQGIYYNSINANHERTYVKDPQSGGVYFWNLVNEGGFIHIYMKDYLKINENATDKQNYEQNLPTILDIGNYIYEYYESIRKDCEGYLLVESTIENVKVSDGKGGYYEVPLEDYVAGVVLGEIAGVGSPDVLMAFAVMARSYGVAYVGTDGSGVILNSSDAQNYNSSYTPERYPWIKEAVDNTKGIIIAQYGQRSVVRSSYDAFCPTTTYMMDGFYYLSDTQQNYPINPEAYKKKTGVEFKINPKYLECVCFQNLESRPANKIFGGRRVRFSTSPTEAPTSPAGYPTQATLPSCWTYNGSSRFNELTQTTEYAWEYKPTGGHGRGASQYGQRYFAAFGYNWQALIRLFYPSATFKRLSSTLEEGECENASLYEGGVSTTIDSCGVTFEVNDSNYKVGLNGRPLPGALPSVLGQKGYDMDCLNGCIGQRVLAAGMGTRQGVAEAAVGLLECTIEMTGGFTYPYDHRGGHTPRNPDIAGKLGANSLWGSYQPWATGCGGSKCRAGLNCANFVRWSMCNGGMDLCTSRPNDTYAIGITGVKGGADYFPGAIRVYLNGNSFSASPNLTVSELSSNYQERLGNPSSKINSAKINDILLLIQPGDVLYSENKDGNGQHAMVIVGADDSAIWIAENGRNTKKITFDELKSNRKNYVVLLLDGFYENPDNLSGLSW